MPKGMLGMLPLSAVRGPRDTLDENLASDDGNLVLEELKKFNKRQPCWQASTAKPARQKKDKVLRRDGSAKVAPIAGHDPTQYYQTRAELYVWGDFATRVVAAAKPMELKHTVKLPRYSLVRGASGEDISTAALKISRQTIFTASEFCPTLAAMLEKQKNGAAGDMLNDGRANLFLVEGVGGSVFLVFVRWDQGDAEWNVRAWPLDSRWHAGNRFFSRN